MTEPNRSARIRFAAAVVLYLLWACALALIAVWSGARPPSASRTSAWIDRPRALPIAPDQLSDDAHASPVS